MNRDAVIARLKSLEPALRDSGVVALYLYGSHARDEARPDSDIDLLADFERGRDDDIMDLLGPCQDIEDAFPGTEIGFSTHDRLVDSYRCDIEDSAILVF
ncbi:nucleotidyltransferase family protein [Aquibium microcysteis]|uniref:nucleotidyltransferase family protein n=1 Tax=Aquibium microcysteis TaxID=675281 RepID=UPI00165D209A|nr:nucleotidyltransferase domain-containing protein [Aquibium microcysteis]